MTYKAVFTGRLRGALGILYTITTTVTADSPEAARLALYDRYEQITALEMHDGLVSRDAPDPLRVEPLV